MTKLNTSKTNIDKAVKYIGKKIIMATPMTRLEYNKYRNWEVPEDENPEDEGYLVEYIDGGKANHPNHKGYISWSPKDVFERAYKQYQTWSDRVAFELSELEANHKKLQSALQSDNKPFDKEAEEALRLQDSVMKLYINILRLRLNAVVTHGVDQNMPLAIALLALQSGHAIARKGWNGKRMYVVKQIPAEIDVDTIPKMQSLPQSAKTLLVGTGTSIKYTNQMLLIQENGRADSWIPSSSDLFAEDWFIVWASDYIHTKAEPMANDVSTTADKETTGKTSDKTND